MQVRRSIGLLVAVLGLGLAPAAAAAAPTRGAEAASTGGGGEFVAGEAIVRYERGATAQARRSARRAAGVEFERSLGLPRAELVEVDGGATGPAIGRLERQPGIAYAQPNYRYQALAEPPDDTFFAELWGLSAPPGFGVSALAAWDTTRGAGEVVAILDTGVDLTHPDLAPNLWFNPGQGASGDGDGNGRVGDVHGYDFVDDDGDPDDYEFHGTHVAGTVTAVAGNGIGIAGVAPEAKIMAVRALDGDGSGSSADIADGIAYAAEEGAGAINLSLGRRAGTGDQLIEDAIALAGGHGAVVVAAAGNDSGNDNDVNPTTPCALPNPNLICVAAVNQSGGLASFSNVGATTVDVGAPGTGILSAKADYGAPLFEEDFESGPTGWVTAASNGGLSWGLITASGNSLATDSPGGDYGAAASPPNPAVSALLSSDPVDLGDERGCRVHFRARYQIENPAPSGAFLDSFDAGAVADSSIDVRRFAGTSTGFAAGTLVRREASISRLDGRDDVKPLFRIVSNATNQFDGAYVDDVRLICRDDTYVDAITPLGTYDQPDAGNYVAFQGTSMATPHVAGVVALVRAAAPAATPAEVVAAVLAGVRPLPALAGKTVTGGTVDAALAVHAALSEGKDEGEADPGALTIAVTERPPALGRVRRPRFAFSANRPASFACSLDGGAFAPCSSPFVPATPLTEGSHGFVVRATDAAGRSGQSAVVDFRIDARRPRVILRKRPPKTVRTRARRALAVFRLESNEPGVRFICRVDGGLPRFCGRRFARRYTVGRHVVRVRAVDPAGNVTRRATVYRFRVKRIR